MRRADVAARKERACIGRSYCVSAAPDYLVGAIDRAARSHYNFIMILSFGGVITHGKHAGYRHRLPDRHTLPRHNRDRRGLQARAGRGLHRDRNRLLRAGAHHISGPADRSARQAGLLRRGPQHQHRADTARRAPQHLAARPGRARRGRASHRLLGKGHGYRHRAAGRRRNAHDAARRMGYRPLRLHRRAAPAQDGDRAAGEQVRRWPP